MDKKERRKTKNIKIRTLVDESKSKCKEFFKEEYRYCNGEAIEELGLDADLIDQLLEDYVIQIIKSDASFKEYLENLKTQKLTSEELDFTPFRELAHKNLGVARNLRIKDSEKILSILMKSDDLESLEECLETLKSCVIKLKPLSAFSTLELIDLKSKLN